MEKKVYLYVFNTMADWEIGYLTAELNSRRYFKKDSSNLKVITMGITKDPIVTMGGIRVIPDMTVDEFSLENTSMLILPGGNTWMDSAHEKIISKIKECLDKKITVAAICGATMRLAEEGILNSVKHTSNDLEYLKMVCPNYKGEQYYLNDVAVTDSNLITASGIAPLEFTLKVLKVLDVFSENTLNAWYNLYKTSEAKYFYDLMNSMQEQ